MADFTVYKPNPLAYAGFGISEGIRRHVEYMQQRNTELQRMALASRELDMRQRNAETEAMSRAQDLAFREKAFLEAKAKDEAQMEFEKEKFNELKKQFGLELPIKRATAMAGFEKAAAATTQAGAAVIRANKPAAPRGKDPNTEFLTTPLGLGKKYAELYSSGIKDAAKQYGLTFENIYDNPEIMDKVRTQAKQTAREGITPYLNEYNNWAETNDRTPIGMGDLEAQPDVEKHVGQGEGDDALNSLSEKDLGDVVKRFQALRNNPDFYSRFEDVKLDDKEIDLIRMMAPDLYKVYVKKIKEKGGAAIIDKLNTDQAEKERRARVDKGSDKK